MNEINIVIDNLCEKLGTTVEYLIPEITKVNTVSAIYGIVIFGIFTVISVLIFRYSWKKYHAEDCYDDLGPILGMATAVMTGVITISLMLSNVGELIKWISSPTAMAISKLMGML